MQRTYAASLPVIVAAALSAWLFVGSPAQAEELPPKPVAVAEGEVPAALLSRLRGQYIPEDSKAADVSESDKVHRYQTILREGGWAERQYPRAANLYQVRELMMAAARGLATLEGSAETRDLVFQIAAKIVNSSAPPESRVVAEMLLIRGKIDQLADSPAEAADEMAAFVARYRGTAGEAKAMFIAAEFCRVTGTAARSEYLRQLADQHLNDPTVSAFLEAEHIDPFPGRLMTVQLRRLDGSPLSLPRDTLGRFTVVHFWSMANSGLVDRTEKGAVRLAPKCKELCDAGVQIVGVNLDTDRDRVARFLREECPGADWPQTCSGLGAKDPLVQQFRIRALPAFWLIGPDGRVISDSFQGGGNPWPQVGSMAREAMDRGRETAIRLPYYRSGEFLLDLPETAASATGEPDAVPAKAIDELRQKVLLPPALGLSKEKKAMAFREAMKFARTIEEEHPRAGNLPAVRASMLVAARWLATEATDQGAAREAQAIAGRILDARTEGLPRLLADYVRVSGELAADRSPAAMAGRRIATLVKKYADGPWEWAARILGVMLALESGDEGQRVALLNDLGGRVDQQPKVRGFLRDFCDVAVDARANPNEAWLTPNGTAPWEVHGEFPKLDGGTLRLDDFRGKLVMIHFWSIARPAIVAPSMRSMQGMAPDPERDLVVIGVNLDRSRDEVQTYLKKHADEYKDWIHVFSGRGQDDLLARELDVYDVPRSVLLLRDGTIYRWGWPGRLGPMDTRSMTGERKVLSLRREAKEITLDLGGKATMRLTLVPAGAVWMGSPPLGNGYFDDELPQRRRYFAKPFYMGVHHVTRGQFAAFVKQTGYRTEAEREGWALLWNNGWQKAPGASWRNCGFEQGDDHPVVCVSWNDAVAFCEWLSRTSGRAVRLPTEARWEYACRAGAETRYPWGSRPEQGKGWCNAADLSAVKASAGWPTFPWDDGYLYTSPAGKFKANAFGLYDMAGNAWQWCSDWYDPELLKPKGPLTDTPGPEGGMYRVVRGGSWNAGPDYCRSAVRRQEPPSMRTNMLGFRVVMELP